ncbi:sodium/glutamate symporter [Shigella flexneri]
MPVASDCRGGPAAMQNAIGIGTAVIAGLDPLMGLLAGWITRQVATERARRGEAVHRTLWLEQRVGSGDGLRDLGPVLGGLIGGPVARDLVKHATTPEGRPTNGNGADRLRKADVGRSITSLVMIETIAMIAICLTVGKIVRNWLAVRLSNRQPLSACCLSG